MQTANDASMLSPAESALVVCIRLLVHRGRELRAIPVLREAIIDKKQPDPDKSDALLVGRAGGGNMGGTHEFI